MSQRVFLVALLVMSVMPLRSPAQAGGAGTGPATRSTRATVLQQRLDNLRMPLNVTDEEWRKLEPALRRLLQARQNLPLVAENNRGWAGDPQLKPGPPDDSPVGKAQTELRTALDDRTTRGYDLAERMTAFRAARDKARADVAAAEKEVESLINARQEGILLALGYID
jgi:hypothetical protein